MTGKVLPFTAPTTIDGKIRAEALRLGVPVDDFIVDLAFKGWTIIQEERRDFIEGTAEAAMDVARGHQLTALGLLKQAARMILSGEVKQPSEDGPTGPDVA